MYGLDVRALRARKLPGTAGGARGASSDVGTSGVLIDFTQVFEGTTIAGDNDEPLSVDGHGFGTRSLLAANHDHDHNNDYNDHRTSGPAPRSASPGRKTA